MKWTLPLIAIGIGILLGLGTFFWNKNQTQGFISPLPSYLDLAKTFGVSTLNLWLPNLVKITSQEEKPEISARSGLVYDLTTDRVIYSKNPREKLPIASLVKIMTAIVVLENGDLSNVYTVSQGAAKIGENSMGLTIGEKLTLEELLYGLLLTSGNDAAEVIAQNFSAKGGGGREDFIKAMNDKAKALGLVDTVFINPSGLEENDRQEYSTTYDLLVITKYALTIPKFVEIVSTYEHVIPYTSSHKAFFLYNDTNLLTTYPGVKGVKPGYTPKAGLCLVTYVENGGHKLIGIILGSQSRREEMRELLDYSFESLGVKVPGRL